MSRTPLDELIAAGEDARLQLVKGTLLAVETSGEHANAQLGIGSGVRAPYHRRPGDSDRPGGWWILVECAIQFTISLRWAEEGWLVLDVVPVDGTFRAPPFEAAAIDWNAVFGKDG